MYRFAINHFGKFVQTKYEKSLDEIISEIKAGQFDQYEILKEFVIYLDKSGVTGGSSSLTGSMLNAVNLGICAEPDGGATLDSGTQLALLSIMDIEVNQAWVDKHFTGLLDTSDGNDEITTINFVGTELPTPNATSGFCQS